ncbi:MAG: cytochrome-c oxidase, partial [Mesorhizobium sp.]
RELTADGYLLTANPANSFFYLITGMHGLHILGGLVGLSRTTAGAWNGARPERLRLSVELCAMYWHFLLFVWLAIFALLAGWAATFIEICRQLLT